MTVANGTAPHCSAAEPDLRQSHRSDTKTYLLSEVAITEVWEGLSFGKTRTG